MNRSFLTCALILAPSAAFAKEVGKLMPPDQSFEVVLDADPGIDLNKVFTMTVKVRPLTEAMKVASFTDVQMDAKMPAHKHGMVVKPKVSATAPNEFKIEGLKLHMAGDWELYLGLKAGALPVFWTVPWSVK